jgi:hypothetical protein
MQYHFSTLRTTRQNILKMVDGLSTAQLNKIPEGFNNNLAWHLGHTLITQQLLNYKLAGLSPNVSDEWIAKYRKGTKPEAPISESEIAAIKEQFLSSIPLLEKNFSEGIFKNYKTYPTSFGVELSSIEDAIIFNNVHEAMHLGNVISMRKLV